MACSSNSSDIRFHPYRRKDNGLSRNLLEKVPPKKDECVNVTLFKRKCIICLDSQECNEINCLPCGHSFHSACINRWLEKNAKCPVCKHLALETDEVKVADVSDDEDRLNDEIFHQEEQLKQIDDLIYLNVEDMVCVDKQIKVAEQRAFNGAVHNKANDYYLGILDGHVESDEFCEESEDEWLETEAHAEELPEELLERLELHKQKTALGHQLLALFGVKKILLQDIIALYRKASELYPDDESGSDNDSGCSEDSNEIDDESVTIE